MSSHNKIVVVESEKSPKVFSTNWKEDLALKRNLQVLDRDENSIVNRITVDQKILLKRFQTKLGRSKMSYARATGNMELQKRLRDRTTFVLNTNIGKIIYIQIQTTLEPHPNIHTSTLKAVHISKQTKPKYI